MYPSISEYLQAIELSTLTLQTLNHLVPLRKPDGQLFFSSGNFAVVFRMQDNRTGQLVALRCFLREVPQRQLRLPLISRYLVENSSRYLLPFTYHTDEIWVDTRFGTSAEFDLITMPWVDGQPLATYVAERCRQRDQEALQQLANQFDEMTHWLLNQPFAHGDLKPDNIMVSGSGRLTLIDYDGFYVPALDGLNASETGTLPYRHPQRTPVDYSRHLDDFSLLALSLELHTLSLKPDLYSETESLLLHTQTIEQPFHSALWEQLRGLQSREVSARASLLEYALHSDAGPIASLKRLMSG
ncbi:protein kinase domain-containing protein [Spirosoma flavum]|uniref:Phosphotransferase n=1 Tax=Spirosoma flavum TaxID=2048557 RepID=A0ABW6ALN4_9BACT